MTEKDGKNFEPQILAFCCKYCAYAAGDLAGSMRLSYPANVKIIQVPCSGRIDMLHLLRAIEDGADGVYVAGCLEGECHFIEGNLKTKKKVGAVQKTLAAIGIAQAHEVRPGYLQVKQVDALTYDLLWKVPAKGDRRIGLYVSLPDTCRSSETTSSFVGGGYIERWRVSGRLT